MIEAELADGTVLEFPDGTDPAVIDRVVKQRASVASQTPEDTSKDESTAGLIPNIPTPQSEGQHSNWEYVKDRMAKRWGDWGDLLRRGSMSHAYDPRVWESLPPDAQESVRTRIGTDKSEEYAAHLGYEGLMPQSETQRWLGIVGEAAVDPLTLLPAAAVPLRAAGALTQTTKPYFMALAEWSAGTAAETLGTLGAETAAKNYRGTEYEGGIVDQLNRVGYGVLFGMSPMAVRPTIGAVGEGFKAVRAVRGQDAEIVSDVLSNASVKAVVDAAVQSQGSTFGDRLQAATRLQKEFPELVIPLIDSMGTNVILEKEFRRLYSSDPTFRQKYDEAGASLKAQFDKYEQGVFPSPLRPGEQIRDPILEEANRKAIAARARGKEKIANIEAARGKLAERYDAVPLSKNINQAAENVAKAAEKAARENASVYYDAAFQFAEESGLRIPATSVEKLWNHAQAQRSADLFADFPSLYRKIQTIWKPKDIPGSDIVDVRGLPMRPGAKQKFSEASIEDLDSLKRELNAAIRTTTDRTKQAALRDLKTELDTQIRAVDPEFARMYAMADSKYYEGVGLPTSLEGYRAVDSARFSTTVAEALTKPEQIRDYLAFVGKDAGMDVVRDALLMKAGRATLNASGEVDPGRLRAFMARNKEALEEVPEIRAMFDGDARLAERIHRGRAKIESTYNTYALEQSQGFFKALTNKNLSAISDEVLTNPGARRTYLDQINGLSPENQKLALTGLRQTTLEKAFNNKGTTVVEYITTNQAAFDELFGAGYTQRINNLAELRDLIDSNSSNLVAAANSHMQSTKFQKVTGLTFEEVVGTMRNAIMSMPRKVLHLGAKAALVKNSAKADKALADVLLDTKGLEALDRETQRLLSALQDQGDWKVLGKAGAEFSLAFAQHLGGYVALRSVQAGTGALLMNDDLAFEASMLPTLEEDDNLFSPKPR